MEILMHVLVWARRVAWHPCTLGWYRLEFKSQRAHTYLREKVYVPQRLLLEIVIRSLQKTGY